MNQFIYQKLEFNPRNFMLISARKYKKSDIALMYDALEYICVI